MQTSSQPKIEIMSRIASSNARPAALFALIVGASILTHFLALAHAAQTGNPTQSSNSESTSSSQPLWSYQIKPSSYVGTGGQPTNSHYTAGTFPSLLDAFSGLSQRQGALTTSPFLSILPIILIAAGGMLLLLPLLTMMMASPFGGGFGGGGYQSPFGYPQVGALNKRRSLDGNQRGIIELIEHFSSTLEDLSRKYSNGSPQQQKNAANGQQQQSHKRSAKALNDLPQAATPVNHKPSSDDVSNSVDNLPLGANMQTN